MASQITSVSIVCSTVYSGVDQRKRQSSASLAFVRGIHRWPVNSQMAGNAENVCISWRHNDEYSPSSDISGYMFGADSRLATSQWDTALHWKLESALCSFQMKWNQSLWWIPGRNTFLPPEVEETEIMNINKFENEWIGNNYSLQKVAILGNDETN